MKVKVQEIINIPDQIANQLEKEKRSEITFVPNWVNESKLFIGDRLFVCSNSFSSVLKSLLRTGRSFFHWVRSPLT